ncbi:MAG: hypothetical protein ACYDA2_05825 [Acidimicrobiales bacterium]
MPDVALEQGEAETVFVTEVLRGMAALTRPGDPPAGGDLTIPLGLSAWIVRASIGLPDAYDAMLRLRSALLEASGLDRISEPVPMRFAEPQAALKSLGAYLFGLVDRAARHRGVTAVELAEEALALVRD